MMHVLGRIVLPKETYYSVAIVLLSVLCLSSGCSSVGGSVGAPTLAQEDLTIVPLDPSTPVIPLIPKPIELKYTTDSTLIPAEDYLTSMLISALGRYQNFKLYSNQSSRIPKSSVPPLTVQVILTESDPFSTIEDSGFDPWDYDNKFNYLWKLPITVGAFWVSMITGLPTVYTTSEIKGVVGLEVVATNQKTGEIVTSFPVHGTHIERARQIGNKMFGASSTQEARSTFSGASRAALADAAKLLFEKLRERYAQ
jgi:hypothetical protein